MDLPVRSQRERGRTAQISARLLPAIVALVLLFWAGFLFAQHLHPGVIGSSAPQPSAAVQPDNNDESAIVGFRAIRKQYREWASAHRKILLRMLHAPAKDDGAFFAVFDAIPHDPTLAGISKAPFIGVGCFSWNWRFKPSANWSAAEKANYRAHETARRAQRRTMFLYYRDFDISDASIGKSRKIYQFWSSGRITESTATGKAQVTDPANWMVREIEPRYDFLKLR